MATRVRDCAYCGKSFEHNIGRGLDRKYCLPRCRKSAKAEKSLKRLKSLPDCKVDNCRERASRVTHGLCERHYGQVRRNGKIGDRKIVGRYVTGSGYIKLLKPDHALSDSIGHVYEHRYIAYKKHGGLCPDCYWCGESLSWEVAVVDHMNEIKDDNKESNLEVSCNNCNRARGAMVPFVKGIKGSSFKRFIETILLMREHDAKTAKEDGGFGNAKNAGS